jgi:hypothetical protein
MKQTQIGMGVRMPRKKGVGNFEEEMKRKKEEKRNDKIKKSVKELDVFIRQ